MDQPVIHLNQKELRFKCSWCKGENFFPPQTIKLNVNDSGDVTCQHCDKSTYVLPPLTEKQKEKIANNAAAGKYEQIFTD